MINTYFMITPRAPFRYISLIYVKNCRLTSFMLANNIAENEATKLTSLIIRLTSFILANNRTENEITKLKSLDCQVDLSYFRK